MAYPQPAPQATDPSQSLLSSADLAKIQQLSQGGSAPQTPEAVYQSYSSLIPYISGREAHVARTMGQGPAALGSLSPDLGGPGIGGFQFGDGYTYDPAQGLVRYANGVIADLNQGNFVSDPTDPNVEGSEAWLARAHQKWGKKQVDSWRNRLAKAGYLQTAKGGFDLTFESALREYFKQKYLHFGKPIAADSSAQAQTTPKDIWDPVEIRNDLRSAFNQITGGDDPTADEMKPFENVVNKYLSKAVQRGTDPQHARLRAQELASQALINDPALSKIQQDTTENTDMRDSFVNIAQALGSAGL